MEYLYLGLGNPLFPEQPLWCVDTKAFLVSFEQEAEAQHWPKEEWVTQLLPALGKEAKLAFSRLRARDKKDYGKVKAAILGWDAMWREKQRQQFRSFSYPEREGPRAAYHRLKDLCCRWLKMETCTKEQILDLLVLEQFINILPLNIHRWIAKFAPGSCSDAVALAEDFLLKQEVCRQKKQVAVEGAAISSQAAQVPSDLQQQQLWAETKQKDDNQEASLLVNDWKSENKEPLTGIFLAQAPFEGTQEKPLCPYKVSTWQEGYRTEEEWDAAIPPEYRVFLEYPIQQEIQRKDGQNKGLNVHWQNPAEKKPKAPHRKTPQSRNLELGKSFSQNTASGSVQRTYSREKHYECLVCRKSFHCQRSLSNHRRVHTVGKPYECSVCRRRLCQACYLIKHQRTHTGDKPHGTSCGGESTCLTSSTGDPQSSQTGDGLDKCLECGKSLGDRSSSEAHKRRNAAEDAK
ncbi:zinc finger and SCAN domain-containing protein 30-like isoform X2 [Hemicordylus capensis]|uniref:zinc finger and SCAN domain-containing protein 30-like isoform X2 n=1 Tax=Hemicordylus capensis TaxID=884348 RepID=UPI002303A2CD|nr:zinc finger and SCAN domain-containing protein 30-like isoform X2 [Hemicordylus capensis]